MYKVYFVGVASAYVYKIRYCRVRYDLCLTHEILNSAALRVAKSAPCVSVQKSNRSFIFPKIQLSVTCVSRKMPLAKIPRILFTSLR
jgi:hypothetical protein